MKHSLIFALIGAVVLPVAGAVAQTGVPDLWLSEVWTEYEGPETLSVMVLPDGGGDPFAAAFLPDGQRTSGVIHLRLLDWMGLPVANFPLEDMWVDASDGGLTICSGGNVASRNTDFDGETVFEGPLQAGGVSRDRLLVFVNAEPVWSNDGLDILVNSADLNGDLEVDLRDVIIFAGDIYGAYDHRSDLHRDGDINISDVVRLVQGFGVECP